MGKCKHYTLDCEQEKRTCEGCAYYDENKKYERSSFMEIKSKYEIGQKVWIVYKNETHKMLEVYTDEIEEIVIDKDKGIRYFCKAICDDITENDVILYEDEKSLIERIKILEKEIEL